MTTDTKIHHLQNLACEDEAQSTGINFMPVGGKVLVWSTFNGYDEWERDSAKWMSTKAARALWKKFSSSPEFEHTHSSDASSDAVFVEVFDPAKASDARANGVCFI